MDTYARKGINRQHQDSVSDVRNDSKLNIRTFYVTTVRDLNIIYSLFETTSELLGFSGLLTSSTVTPSPAVQKSVKKYSRSVTKKLWRILYCSILRLTCQATLILVQVPPLKNVICPKPSNVENLTVVCRGILPCISVTLQCDFMSSNYVTSPGIVTSFVLVAFFNRSRIVSSNRNLRSIGNDLHLPHSSREVTSFVRSIHRR